MKDYQRAYHGSHRHFDHFNLDFINSGVELAKFGHGIYLTSDIRGAEFYREQYAEGGSRSDKRYKLNGQLLDSDSQHAQVLSYYLDNGTFPESVPEDIRDAIESSPHSVEYGALYEVRAPSPERLLHLNGGIADQPLDLAEFARSFYGEEMVEDEWDHLYEMACEESFSFNDQDLEALFDKILLEDVTPLTYEAVRDYAPDYNLDDFLKRIGSKKITIDPECAGRTLYESLTYSLGSAQAASEALLRAGVPGMILEATPVGQYQPKAGEHSISVIWDVSELKILHRYEHDFDRVVQRMESNRVSRHDTSPGW